MPLISVCIPTYEMNGSGRLFLQQSFNILTWQTLKDFDVIVSDHSTTDVIKTLCDEYADRLDIHYYHNPNNIGNSSANLNNAIKHATGKLIKFLFQDDFLFSPASLQEIVNNFNVQSDHWLVTACEHTVDGKNFIRPFYPKYSDDILLGNNTISSPSVVTIINDRPLKFDERLIWLMDCEYYRRCYDAFGLPKILNTINVINRTGGHQVSHTLATKKLQNYEYAYVLKKYHMTMPFMKRLKKCLRDYSL